MLITQKAWWGRFFCRANRTHFQTTGWHFSIERGPETMIVPRVNSYFDGKYHKMFEWSCVVILWGTHFVKVWCLFAKAYIIQFHISFWFHILKLCLFPLQNQEAVVAQSPCSRTGSKMKIEGVTYQWFWCGKFPKNKSNKKSSMVGSIIYLPQWPPENVVEVFERLFVTIYVLTQKEGFVLLHKSNPSHAQFDSFTNHSSISKWMLLAIWFLKGMKVMTSMFTKLAIEIVHCFWKKGRK